MGIEQFVALSEGTWRSMRSGHSLAFQQFEEVISEIQIKQIAKDSKLVKELISTTKFKELDIKAPFSIEWNAESDWDENEDSSNSKGLCILIPIPISNKEGVIIRSLGYAEAIQAESRYNFLSDKTFVLSTKYGSSSVEERIWFLSENFRCRSSVIKTSNGEGILQTSFASEVRHIKKQGYE